jgi:mono/diheme cytochrome c family protein
MTRTKIFAATTIFAGLIATTTGAGAFQLPPVSNAATLKECSACHMIYPPQMLPARSWTAMMGNLASHFGESATLDAKTQADITAYLTANAADVPPYSRIRGLLAGVQDSDVPQRITEMPWWKTVHGEIPAAAYARPDIKSASNCVACHRSADKGQFSEEEGAE